MASAHDIPDKIELEDDNDDGAQNGRIGQPFVAVNDAEIEGEKEVSSVAHVVKEESMVEHRKCPQDNKAEHCGLSRRKMKNRKMVTNNDTQKEDIENKMCGRKIKKKKDRTYKYKHNSCCSSS